MKRILVVATGKVFATGIVIVAGLVGAGIGLIVLEVVKYLGLETKSEVWEIASAAFGFLLASNATANSLARSGVAFCKHEDLVGGKCRCCGKEIHGTTPDKSYVGACLSSGLKDLPEKRDAWHMPDVEPAHFLGSGCATQELVRLGHALISKYPDLDMPYYWLSHHYLLKGDVATARQLLDQGLRLCKRKTNLCSEYGTVEYESGNISEAVKWWTREAVLQITSGAFDSYSCFLYLGYVGGWCGLSSESELLFRVTDVIRSLRLNDSGQQKLRLMVSSADPRHLATVIKLLVSTYRTQLSVVAQKR